MKVEVLFHSSQNPTCKLAARTFIQPQYLEELAANLRVGFCDEWKRGWGYTLDPSFETYHYIVLFILFVVIIGICSVQVVSLRKISRELWKHAVVLFKHLPIVWHRTFWERASCLRKCRLAAKGRVFYYFLLELTISRMKMNNAGIMLLILFMYGILGWNVVYACASVTSEWHKPR